MWTVLYTPEAVVERSVLPSGEQAALINADRKLEALGPSLPYPHSSAIKAADRLRELRPRGGRSPWRALSRRIGDVFVIAALGGRRPWWIDAASMRHAAPLNSA